MKNSLKKFKNIKTKDGTDIKLELIEDISNYRGYYFIFPDGDKTKANYNSFCFLGSTSAKCRVGGRKYDNLFVSRADNQTQRRFFNVSRNELRL